MTIRGLRENEQEECLDLWAAAFPETGRDYFVKYFRGDANWRPDDTIICEDGGRLVSAVSIVRRVIGRGDLRLNMAGIANVGTLPDERGKGHSTACLRRAIAYMEAEDFDFSLLGTGIHDYYARLGWVRTPLPAYSATIPADAERSAESVRPAIAADLPAIRALYAAHNAGCPLAVERPDWYWSGWLNIHENNIPKSLYVAESGAEVMGYMGLNIGDDTIFLQELAAKDAQTEKRLIAAALSEAGQRTAIHIRAALSPEAWAMFPDRRPDFADGWMSRMTVPLRVIGKIAAQSGQETAKVAALLNAQTRENIFAFLYGTAAPESDDLRNLFPSCSPRWYEGDGF